MLDKQIIETLEAKAKDIRISTIREIAHLGNGHIGGAMSIVEVLTYLYYHEMNIDPSNPKMEGRDRFVCSKGHAGPSEDGIEKMILPGDGVELLTDYGPVPDAFRDCTAVHLPYAIDWYGIWSGRRQVSDDVRQ